MKKLIFTSLILLTSFSFVNAQRNKTIGIRFADGGGGGEISFQAPVGSSNRIELDLGAYSLGYYRVSGIYQWERNLNLLGPGFKWYFGFGAIAGNYFGKPIGIDALAQLGIEYNFNIPLQISFDLRPSFFGKFSDGYYSNGLAVRYRF